MHVSPPVTRTHSRVSVAHVNPGLPHRIKPRTVQMGVWWHHGYGQMTDRTGNKSEYPDVAGFNASAARLLIRSHVTGLPSARVP